MPTEFFEDAFYQIPSYLGGRDQENWGLKPVQANSSLDPTSKISNTKMDSRRSTCPVSVRSWVQTPVLPQKKKKTFMDTEIWRSFHHDGLPHHRSKSTGANWSWTGTSKTVSQNKLFLILSWLSQVFVIIIKSQLTQRLTCLILLWSSPNTSFNSSINHALAFHPTMTPPWGIANSFTSHALVITCKHLHCNT
jgi:hypothetical protein